MAIINTVTASMLQPFVGVEEHVTKQRVEYLQTTGALTTQGSIEIFADPAAGDNFFLTSLDLSFTAPTASVDAIVYIATTPVAYIPTMAAGVTVQKSFNWGPMGINGGTTTTATVYVFTTVGTCTCNFVATGYRKL